MRFAYIDSQGNEVSIPSVDALALRIELGAIGPETQLYDAQADQWGPANSHEIFHTLSRAKEDEGFIAPPPPVMPPPESGEEDEEPAAEEEEAEEDDLGLDLALTLTEPDSPDPEPETPAAEDEMDFGIGLMDDPSEPAPAEAADAPAEEGGSFDFGDVGMLEVEADGDDEEESKGAADGGMELEQPLSGAMDFSPDAGDAETFGGGLDLESPMSDFGTEDSPAWMEQDGPAADSGAADEGDPDAMDFQSPAAEATAGEASGDESPRREAPEPRSRPSPPRRRRRKLMPMVMGVVVVGAIGAGGYFAWPLVDEWMNRPKPEVVPPGPPAVVIPDIPPELLPTMRDLAEAALSDLTDALAGMQGQFDLAVEPRNDWLSGSYLGTASQFEDVEQYWLGIEAFVDHVREVDAQVFHDMYVARVEAAGIVGDTATMLIERADSGFVAARDKRFEAYNQMDDLINAALELHVFLLDNEADITYEPAAGGLSRDPVLEAVPSSEALGGEMWAMVSNITDALDSLGTLNRVTTERIMAVLFDRIRGAGVE